MDATGITTTQPAFGETTKVIIIEDQTEQRKIYKRALDSLKVKILEAGNAKEAMNYLDEKNVALIICDLYLPDIDGFELIKEFKSKENFVNVPFIVITGSVDEVDLKTMLDHGANDFLKKPFSIIEFLSRVKAQLRLKRYFDEEKLLNEKLKDLNEKLAELANIDYLTGIYNRRYIIQKLNKFVQDYNKSNSSFFIVLFDLDNFREINSKYGHLSGDELLAEITVLVEKDLNDNNIFGRFGGEEFIIIIPDVEKEEAIRIAEKLRLDIDKTNFKIKDDTIKITVSFGVTQFRKGDTINEILMRADNALHKAKSKNKVDCK